ncbi:MAG: right-handed parallel beta-helix repeat-containing protein [Verrucomicrobia bacterium]|nr:right-handed parallel beta-helix repeat-containing protein [Verrucomicrobiota bacterium]
MADDLDDLALGMTIRGNAAGQRLFGRFVLKKILGRGGMGMVWLAWDERLEREVALKFLPDLLRADEAALDDLKRETRRGLDLAHPHIVRVYDLVEEPNAAAIAMEYVDGPTLGSMRVQRPQKFFEVAEIAQWVRQLCEALDYAHHRAKVVHRDLKPANLMINGQGDLKVTDFGIARSINDSVSRVTQDRGTSGTLLYMSPQQALGKKPSIGDDVYAVGATIFELLTSKPPFYSGNIARQLDEVEAPTMADRRQELELAGAPIPPEWEATVRACLAKNPEQRPQEAIQIAEMLGLSTGSRMSYAGGSSSMAGASQAGSSGSSMSAGLTPAVPLGNTGATVGGAGMTAAGGTIAGGTIFQQGQGTSNSKAGLMGAVAALLVLALGAGGWWMLKKPPTKPDEKDKTEEVDPAKIAAEALRIAEERRKAEELANAKAAEEKRKAEEEARAKAGPQTITVPDQHKRVQEAIDAARPGDTVLVKAGRYVECIVFKDGVKLIGENSAQTRIEAANAKGKESVIFVENCRSGSIENLTISGGGFEVDGILLQGSVIQVLNCRIESVVSGIVAQGAKSAPIIKGNKSMGNARHGIYFQDSSRGTAEGNECENNALSGIAVLQSNTAPELRRNRCRGNGKHGIEFSYNAAGTAEENLCENNKGAGIVVTQAGTSPVIQRNTMKGNGMGLAFTNQAAGSAENNTIEDNTQFGVLLSDGTTAEIRSNFIRGNKRDGVQALRQATALIEGNTIENNENNGIVVSDPQTKPTIRGNKINKNKQWGLIAVNGADPNTDNSNKFSENVLGSQTKR